MSKLKILFLCTGNSCRSQMAEGWCRYFHEDKVEAYSAGIEKHGLNPFALRVMKEAGVNIDNYKSQNLEDLEETQFDYVFTVCGHAHESCPVFPGKAKIIHTGFEDPPFLAKGLSDEDEILAIYRRVRDEIKETIMSIEKYIK